MFCLKDQQSNALHLEPLPVGQILIQRERNSKFEAELFLLFDELNLVFLLFGLYHGHHFYLSVF